jgi:hypothetical protein
MDDNLVQALGTSQWTVCAALTSAGQAGLQASLDRACAIRAGYGWERRAAAHAEFFTWHKGRARWKPDGCTAVRVPGVLLPYRCIATSAPSASTSRPGSSSAPPFSALLFRRPAHQRGSPGSDTAAGD